MPAGNPRAQGAKQYGQASGQLYSSGGADYLALTLAELHVLVLTSFIKLIKLLQNLMKLLQNHIMV